MEDGARTEGKKSSPLFSLGGTPIAASKSEFPIGELRALGKEVQASHFLKGALRLVEDEWVLGIKFPTKASAEKVSSLLCFRWDGHFGSALTLTAGEKTKGWIARGWIWSLHPAMSSVRSSQALTVVSIYNGQPVSVVRMRPVSEKSLLGIEFASDVENEANRRPDKQLLELDKKLTYWETFALTDSWDGLLSATDYLQIGWLREFRNALRLATHTINDEIQVPSLSDDDKRHWEAGGHECPSEFWAQSVLAITEVLRGNASILHFIRTNSAGNILLVIADDEQQRDKNPFHSLRGVIGTIAECALLAETRTQYGRQVVFSALSAHGSIPVEISTVDLSIEDAKTYWENLPSIYALNARELVTDNMKPANLASMVQQIKNIKLGCDLHEAEDAITTMTEEANILNRWTIPWGARVQTRIGPFSEVDFYSYADEISILLKTSDNHYRWAAFNLRTNTWNMLHLFRNRFESIHHHITDDRKIEEIECAFKLILASIVRDFVVLEERDSTFAIQREKKSPFSKSIDDGSPRIIYIPRIRYAQSPDTKTLDKGLEYESRRAHHVRAHQRRADLSSPYQRILAERYGFRLEPGYTFVKPHQRGGITPEREVIYRSRSAMQSLYGIESSIESNGKSDWFKFERDVHDAMEHAGYKVDHVASAKNGDAGVDVFAENKSGNEFWAIQCKCYASKRKVGPAAIRELIGALAGYPSGTSGMMVTTSGFSTGAVELAKKSGIKLRLLGFSDQASGHKTLIEI